GGSDASIATGGVVLNMVTKRGTNEWRGSGRFGQAKKGWQSSTNVDKGSLGKAGAWNANAANPTGTAQPTIHQGNQIVKVEEYGAELGGPLVKDKLWIWGSWSRQHVDLLTIANVSDKTTLPDWNGKLNWQIVPANSLTLFAWSSDKKKLGRNAGPTRPQETTFDQSAFGDKPTAEKIEDTHIFSSSFY